MEKKIRLVLTRQQETREPVSITPMKRPRQHTEEEEDDDHPFMDDELNAYKFWLENLPLERKKGILYYIFFCLYCYCS